MELKNKKLAFLGDSITQGVGIDSIDDVYWNVLARKTGATCVGDGIGGTRIAQQLNADASAVIDHLFFPVRVDHWNTEADVIVVFGGTNDFGHGNAPFGHMSDRTTESFYGALHVLCQKLIDKYPSAVIVFMTPLHRYDEFSSPLNECGFRREHQLVEYVDAIKEVASYYSMPVLDLYRTSGMASHLEIQKNLFMPDGIHPNERGHVRIAERLMSFLFSL